MNTKSLILSTLNIFVYTDADSRKGGAVVIPDVKDYIKESERKLSNAEHCKHLEHDSATVNNVIPRFRNDRLISGNISNRLKLEFPRTPRFYTQSTKNT